ncbi:hypothetical protein L7F22_024828 [Adiantum nelumboides]|nr:hypothetical protein [Adiantum nelumboides]
MSAPFGDCRFAATVLERKDDTQKADNSAKLRAEVRGKQMQMQLMRKMNLGARDLRCSKSPVSPLQCDYIGLAFSNQHQSDADSLSSGSTSHSWGIGQHSETGHIQSTYKPTLEDAYQNEAELNSPSNNGWEDPDFDFESLPRHIDGEPLSAFHKGCIHSPQSQEAAVQDDDCNVFNSLPPISFEMNEEQSHHFGKLRSPFTKSYMHSPDRRLVLKKDCNVLKSLSPKSSRESSEQRNLVATNTLSSRRALGDFCDPQVVYNENPSLDHGTSLALHTTLKKAQWIQKQIEKSSSNLEYATMRLPALELAMGPLSAGSAHMTSLCSLIEQTTDPAFVVLQAFQDVQKLTPAIRAGPGNVVALGIYLEQVSTLEKLLHFLRGNASHVMQLLQNAVEMLGESRVINKLSLFKFREILATVHLDGGFSHDQQKVGNEVLEFASTHLESCFARILAENAHITTLTGVSADNLHKNLASIPETSLNALNCIARKLTSFGKLRNCLTAYEKARGIVIRKSLKTLGASARYLQHWTPEAVQALPWETLEDHISKWVQQVEVVIKRLLVPERGLISQVFDQCGDTLPWETCFVQLAMKGALQHWLRFGIAVVRSGKDPQKLFKLLDMFECMEGLKEVVEKDVLSGIACKQGRIHMAAVQEELMNGASSVLRAFGSQVEGDREAAAPLNGGVMKLTSYVVNYVNCMLGAGYRPLIGRVMHSEEGKADKLGLVLLDLMQALERNLDVKAKGLKEAHPALAQLFLMNNHWYIYTRSKNTELATILGTPWLKQHKQRAEKCAMRYRQEGWGSLVNFLSGPDGLALSLGNGGVSRGLLRQNICEFDNAFAEFYRMHQNWRVPDPLLRPQLGITVLRAFVPLLSAFFGQFAVFLPAAYQLEYPPQRVQGMIAALFDVPEASLMLVTPPPPAAVPAKLRSFH